MNLVTLLYLTGLSVILLSFLCRLGYDHLPKDKALINNVTYKCDYKNNLFYVKLIIEYIVDNNKKYKALSVVFKKNDFFIKNKFVSELENLNGRFIDFYYIPGLKRYGYLDCQLLLIPIWIYLVVLISYSFIVFFILNPLG